MEELLDVCDVGIATNGTVNPYVAVDFSRMNFVSVSYHTPKARKFIDRVFSIKEANKKQCPFLLCQCKSEYGLLFHDTG